MSEKEKCGMCFVPFKLKHENENLFRKMIATDEKFIAETMVVPSIGVAPKAMNQEWKPKRECQS